MSFNPQVSIIIPVYNGSNFLREAIDSALSQTYENIEVIVINDGSNDSGKTEAIAKSFGDKIRYFCKENGGVATALNLGIRQSRGEYISWLSHDDLYHKNKIEVQIDRIKKINNQKIIVFSDYDVHNYIGNEKYTAKLSDYKFSTAEMLKLLFKSSIHACSLLFPKSCFDDVGYFSEELRTIQDYDLLFSLLENNYIFFHIPEPLIVTRHHKDQDTHRLIDHHINELYMLYKSAVDTFIDEFKIFSQAELNEFKKVMEGRGLTKLAGMFDDLMEAIENIKRIDAGVPVIWLYWENRKGKETPVIIKYCHETIKLKNYKDFIVVTTNKDNINYYLSDLCSDYLLLEKIAHRADYLRFNLLYRYGGIWLDSDFVCFKTLMPIVEKIEKHEFVYTGYEMKDGNIFPIIHFLGAKKSNKILKSLIDNVHNTLSSKVKNGVQPEWDEIGGYSLMPLLNKDNSYLFDTSYFSRIDVHGYGQRQMFFPANDKFLSTENAFGQMLCYSVHSDFFEIMGEDILNMNCYIADILKMNLTHATFAAAKRENIYRKLYNEYKWIFPRPFINFVKSIVGTNR